MRLNIKDWTLLALIILTVAGTINMGFLPVIGQVVLSLLIFIGVGSAIIYNKTKKFKVSSADAITALIIATVLVPSSPWWIVLVVCAGALAAKHVILYKHRNLFNPAAFGLAFGLPFGAHLGWWAAFLPMLTVVIGSALLIEYRNRWKLILSFLGTLFVLLVVLESALAKTSVVDSLYLIIGSSFFFTFFMLTDPKTSPARPLPMILFGMITALGTVVSWTVLPDTIFIGGLLVANALTPMLNDF